MQRSQPGKLPAGPRDCVARGRSSATPDEPEDPFFERAREMWVPLDSGAEKLVAQAKKDVEKMNKERAQAAAERKRLEEEGAAAVFAREFKTREDQGPGVSRSERFRGKFVADENEQARNDAWTKQVQKEAKKGGAVRGEAGGAGRRARASGARWRCRRAARRRPERPDCREGREGLEGLEEVAGPLQERG
jgi:hypothetical protein